MERAVGADVVAPAARIAIGCLPPGWASSRVSFVGYPLPSQSVVQVLGPVIALPCAGGLRHPPSDRWTTAAKVFPTHGVANPTRLPFGGKGAGALVILVLWWAFFPNGGMRLLQRDTAGI